MASSNGLGHARRLLSLATGLSKIVDEVSLAITSKQKELLQSEIESIHKSSKLSVIEIGNHGLEPTIFLSRTAEDSVSKETQQALISADAVLSDNSLWPAKFNPHFFLFGHFDWITYVDSLPNEVGHLVRESQIYQLEKNLREKALGWFKTKDFAIHNQFLESVALEVPFIRYENDKKFSETRGESAWFSMGTTGRNMDDFSRMRILGKRLIRKESWNMTNSPTLPTAVLGRPGFGTIRDCLASATPFFSVWKGSDPELSSNELKMNKLGLSRNHTSTSLNAIDPSTLKSISSEMKKYWSSSSATQDQVAFKVKTHIVRELK